MTVVHDRIVANSDRKAVLDGTFSKIVFREIDFYVYSFVMTEEERNQFIQTRNSGGIPFVYKVFSNKRCATNANTAYDETALGAPSQLLVRTITMF